VAPFLREDSSGVHLSVKLQPRAASNEIGTPLGKELKIRVTAPPVDSAANQALLDLLAKRLRCPSRSLRLVRGHTSRHKIVLIQNITASEIERRLLT